MTDPAAAAPRTIYDDVTLLGDIADFAGRIVAKPMALPPDEWVATCESFSRRLAAAFDASAHSAIVGNFAPLLVTAMCRAVAVRRAGDAAAAVRWESLISHLVPCVREDARELLSKGARS